MLKNSVLGKVKIIGVFLMTFFLLFLCFSSYPISAKVPTIVINPGHLVGRDSGAVNNNNNIQEATLNAELASKVAEKLKDIGYDVFLTHPVTGCSIPALLTTQQVIDGYNSNSSLKTIGDAINSKNPDLAISIHHNSGGNASGYEFYWSSYRAGIDNTDIYKVYGLWGNGDFSWRDKSPCNAALKSKDFAELLKANFSGIGIPFRNIIERDDYIPAHTKCPSVLIEAGFVSNDNESRKLADNTYQNDEANRIVKSIKQLFGEVAVKASGIVTSESSQVNNNVFSVNAEQLKMEGSNISGVSFEVYKNGKIVWYDGIYKSADKFTANVPTKDFNYETGLYGINAYVKDSLGNHYRLGTTFVTVANTKITGKVERLESETTGNSFQIKALDLSPAEQVSGVSYEVYIGDRATWYAGEKQADGSYLGTADIGDFDNIRGEYKINVYGKDQNMVHYKIGETAVQVKNNLTNIMANLHISSNQLVELYNSSGNTFPSYYTENGRNVDLNRFAQLYIEEANAEGIRADVAFAQAMKETGWLKFGGQVSISQFNFAGLGATDDGAAGMSFAQKYGDNENGIRMGIRAQIQHLKAYASTEPLNNACVDERFNLVKRGCAPYVEWLGQKENPNGYGWATGANYGQGIIDIMNRIP